MITEIKGKNIWLLFTIINKWSKKLEKQSGHVLFLSLNIEPPDFFTFILS